MQNVNAKPGQSGIGKEIEYLGVTKRYGTATALHPTDLTIGAGEFFSIIGPSGSGKTTLLGLTVGFVAPSGGQIRIDGARIEGVPPFRRNIGMVFQNYSLFQHKTVAQNIAFPLQMRGLPRTEIATRVEQALRLVRLPNLGDRYPGALSGGQQQRVALARASVYNPSLLVMDEPLSALDKNLREEMQYEIKQLQHQMGCTVLYVTHDQGEAAAMADRIAIMQAGRIAQIGTARGLYSNPANSFIAAFLGQANLVDVTAAGQHEGRLQLKTRIGPDLLAARYPADRAGKLRLCVRPEAMRISEAMPTSENVISGVLEDAIFSNGLLRHRVRVAEDLVFEQSEQVLLGTAHLPIGAKVHLGWAADDTIVVPAE